jgi:hypothetical protein
LSAYTLLQLVEVAIAALILLIGVLSKSAPVALLGGGFLMGKAILNILWPEGGTVYRRSLIAYFVAGLFVLGGIVAFHFAG